LAKILKAYIIFYEKADIKKYFRVFESIPISLQDRADVVAAKLQAALFDRDWTKAKEILSRSAGEEFELGYSHGGDSRELGEVWLFTVSRSHFFVGTQI
jgi:hypothetical protein